MANFPTHIAVGTVVSGAFATLTLAANVISEESLVAVTLAGVVGSILPDIDLKESRPSRAFFAGLAVFFSFCVLFWQASRLSIAELWIAWLGTLFFIRYPAHTAFNRFSYHRGIWHSLLAAAFFWFLTAIIYKHLFGFPEGVAWLAGGFVFIGYITHLILDEIYSVDISGHRLKASFGTALKFYDHKNLLDTGVIAVACLLAFAASPPASMFIDGITSKQLWAGLERRLLPHDKWFGIVPEFHRAHAGGDSGATATGTSAISTGSVAPAAGGPVVTTVPAGPVVTTLPNDQK